MQALNGPGLDRVTPFRNTTYTEVLTASYAELTETTSATVERLLRRLARGAGVERRVFAYDHPQELHQRL